MESVNQPRQTNPESTAWDDLKETPMAEQSEQLEQPLSQPEQISQPEQSAAERLESLTERAKLYRKFGRMALLLSEMEESRAAANQPTEIDQAPISAEVQESEKSKEDIQAESFVKQLESALGEVDDSLAKQMSYNIVNHKQINTREALEEELQSGTGIPELDIRFDKDGTPWISHSPRSGARFFFSKPIHKCTTEEVAKQGQRLPLEEGLSIIEKYAAGSPDYRVVLELKELGPSAKTHGPYLESLKKMLEQHGMESSTIFATLSPEILEATQDVFPENSKILNGGIAPIISYDIARKTMEESGGGKEFALKLPNVELFFSNATKISRHEDGYGKQTGYLWFRLPFDTAKTLKKMNESKDAIGAASLTVVNKVANIIELANPKAADSLRKYYLGELKKLGIAPQLAISKTKPVESISGILSAADDKKVEDVVFYSDTSPGEWAKHLPPKNPNQPRD